MKELKLHWYTKWYLKTAPKRFLRSAASAQGVDGAKLDYTMKLFDHVQRVDIEPLPSRSGRGFIIYLDSRLALFFYQDGDHFKFDGFEMGEYDKGEVTVFDALE